VLEHQDQPPISKHKPNVPDDALAAYPSDIIEEKGHVNSRDITGLDGFQMYDELDPNVDHAEGTHIFSTMITNDIK